MVALAAPAMTLLINWWLDLWLVEEERSPVKETHTWGWGINWRMGVAIHQPHHPTVHLYMHEMGHMELYPAEKELKELD